MAKVWGGDPAVDTVRGRFTDTNGSSRHRDGRPSTYEPLQGEPTLGWGRPRTVWGRRHAPRWRRQGPSVRPRCHLLFAPDDSDLCKVVSRLQCPDRPAPKEGETVARCNDGGRSCAAPRVPFAGLSLRVRKRV